MTNALVATITEPVADPVMATAPDRRPSISGRSDGGVRIRAAAASLNPTAIVAEPVAIPDELSFDQPSALPTAGEAALRAYRAINVSAGDVLVVHGAAGAIGLIVTQPAVADHVTVVGTVGNVNDDEMLRALGGQPVRHGDGWVDRVQKRHRGSPRRRSAGHLWPRGDRRVHHARR